MCRVRDLGTLSLNSLPSGIREYCAREKMERLYGPLGMEDTVEMRPSRHNRTDIYMNSENETAFIGSAQV